MQGQIARATPLSQLFIYMNNCLQFWCSALIQADFEPPMLINRIIRYNLGQQTAEKIDVEEVEPFILLSMEEKFFGEEGQQKQTG